MTKVRKRWVGAALVGLGAACGLFLLRRGSVDSTRAVSATRIETPVPAEGWRGARVLSARVLSARGNRPAPSLEAFLDAATPPAPTPSEREALHDDYVRFASEREDAAASHRLTEYVAAMLAHHRIVADSARVSCTETLCRAALTFSDEEELRALAHVPSDRDKIRVGAPSVEGETATLVAYWDRAPSGRTPF